MAVQYKKLFARMLYIHNIIYILTYRYGRYLKALNLLNKSQSDKKLSISKQTSFYHSLAVGLAT